MIMGRKPLIDHRHLMQKTEKLLMEHGYHGFTYKRLAQSLGVARSTLYEYYANKDELISAYMLWMMEEVLAHLAQLDQHYAGPSKIEALLRLFIQHKEIHLVSKILPLIEKNESASVQAALERLWSYHDQLFNNINRLIEQGKKEGWIKPDLTTEAIAGFISAVVFIPIRSLLAPDELIKQLTEIVLNGITLK